MIERWCLLLLMSISINSSLLGKRHIIFDLSGVLVDTNKLAVLQHTEISTMIPFHLSALLDGQSPLQLLNNFLHSIRDLATHEVGALDEAGRLLPQLFCDWLKGVDGKTLLQEIEASMNELKINYFSPIQKQGCIALSRMIFNPEKLIATKRLIQEGVRLVNECKNKGYSVYILSNWDKESWVVFKNQHSEFVSLFDGAVISGDCGIIKPDQKIYQYILDVYQLPSKDCFFIDDQAINIAAAESVGIAGTVCPWQKGWISNGPNFEAVRKALREWELYLHEK